MALAERAIRRRLFGVLGALRFRGRLPTALLLADEPTGNLDSATADAVLELFADLNEDGRTIVVVTHERDIRSLVSREVTLMDGRVVADEPQRARVPA